MTPIIQIEALPFRTRYPSCPALQARLTVATVCTSSHSVITGPLPAMTLRRATRARIRSLGSAQKKPRRSGASLRYQQIVFDYCLFFSDEGMLPWPDEPDVEDDEPL